MVLKQSKKKLFKKDAFSGIMETSSYCSSSQVRGHDFALQLSSYFYPMISVIGKLLERHVHRT